MDAITADIDELKECFKDKPPEQQEAEERDSYFSEQGNPG